MRRAKFVFDRTQLHELLRLGPLGNVRVVAVYTTNDPDQVHIVIEGNAVPASGETVLAAQGLTEAPIVRWPIPAGPNPTGTISEQWFLDPEAAARRMMQRVDEDVAADPSVAVNACQVDETVGGGEPGKLSVMDRLHQAAADAAQAGEPPFALLSTLQDAIRRTHEQNREAVRRELLETAERVAALLEKFMQHENDPGRG